MIIALRHEGAVCCSRYPCTVTAYHLYPVQIVAVPTAKPGLNPVRSLGNLMQFGFFARHAPVRFNAPETTRGNPIYLRSTINCRQNLIALAIPHLFWKNESAINIKCFIENIYRVAYFSQNRQISTHFSFTWLKCCAILLALIVKTPISPWA
ncbi:MAG: hypothetical protein RL748_4301 [Pseudomonadota bacterium]